MKNPNARGIRNICIKYTKVYDRKNSYPIVMLPESCCDGLKIELEANYNVSVEVFDNSNGSTFHIKNSITNKPIENIRIKRGC